MINVIEPEFEQPLKTFEGTSSRLVVSMDGLKALSWTGFAEHIRSAPEDSHPGHLGTTAERKPR